MADTRKEKLQALLDAIEASKAKMEKQQLMEVLQKKQPAPSIIPEDMRIAPEYEAAPATTASPPVNLPFTEGAPQVAQPLPYSPKKNKSRLYRMMQ